MSAALTLFRRLRLTLEMIRFSHTLFALPFAAGAALAAAGGLPSVRQALGILGAMVGARSAAMAFNRLADERYDRENPRTASRHLPAGLLTRRWVAAFTAGAAALFVASAASLNALCGWLSLPALAWILGYSYAKRFTSLAHLWLGLALGLAPAGAWAAVRGTLAEAPPWWLCGAVALWTAGFDLLYACQDADADRRAGLHAVPARWGVPAALRLSAWLHIGAFLGLLGFARSPGLGPWTMAAVLASAAILAWEHRLVSADDLSRLDTAFFTANAAMGGVFAAGVAADMLF